MKQMNSKLISELYNVSSRLNNSFHEMTTANAIIKQNPSSNMRERERIAIEEYIKALDDFENWLNKYEKFKEEN